MDSETLSRGIQQLSPHSWTKFNWGSTRTFGRYLGILMIIALELTCELNAFYLKSLLWIPVPNYLNSLRLFYYFMICLPAVREAYQFMIDPNCKRLGMYAWMATINILTELLIILKFSKGEFKNPFPLEVEIFWGIFMSILIAYPIYQFALSDNGNLKKD